MKGFAMKRNDPILPYLLLSQREGEEKLSACPQEEEIFSLAEFFKLFADTTRMRILFLLAQGELCVGDLAALMDMTPSAVSHQLKLLKSRELVRYRRKGKILFYSLSDDHVHHITKIGLEHIKE